MHQPEYFLYCWNIFVYLLSRSSSFSLQYFTNWVLYVYLFGFLLPGRITFLFEWRWHFFVKLCITNRISLCRNFGWEQKQKKWNQKRGQAANRTSEKVHENYGENEKQQQPTTNNEKNWDPIYCILLFIECFLFFLGFSTHIFSYAFCSNVAFIREASRGRTKFYKPKSVWS